MVIVFREEEQMIDEAHGYLQSTVPRSAREVIGTQTRQFRNVLVTRVPETFQNVTPLQ
jgi:hypothetical protein